MTFTYALCMKGRLFLLCTEENTLHMHCLNYHEQQKINIVMFLSHIHAAYSVLTLARVQKHSVC